MFTKNHKKPYEKIITNSHFPRFPLEVILINKSDENCGILCIDIPIWISIFLVSFLVVPLGVRSRWHSQMSKEKHHPFHSSDNLVLASWGNFFLFPNKKKAFSEFFHNLCFWRFLRNLKFDWIFNRNFVLNFPPFL
jgi:hypothetical protein